MTADKHVERARVDDPTARLATALDMMARLAPYCVRRNYLGIFAEENYERWHRPYLYYERAAHAAISDLFGVDITPDEGGNRA